jgi:hypothetical protein
VAERNVRLLVDLPTLAVGVAPFGGGQALLGASGEILVYAGGEPTILVAGLQDPTCLRADGDGLLVTERRAGRVVRVDAGGTVTPLVTGLASAAAVDVAAGGFAVTTGTTVVLVDAHGERRTIDGFADAQGVAAAGEQIVVADAGRHELVMINLGDGRRETIVSGAPIGLPAAGVVPAAFTPLASDGAGGVLVGCNGDGSIRRLTRV